MNNIKRQYFDKKNNYHAVFLPGLPGEFHDRPLTEDLKRLGFNIYSLVYPGTYKVKGTLSPQSVSESIKQLSGYFNKLKSPTLIVTYSFSTYFILPHLKSFNNLLGVLFFSPILDLHKSVNSDVIAEMKRLSNNDGFNVDVKSFQKQIFDNDNLCIENYLKLIQKSKQAEVPLIFFVGQKDSVIKRTLVDKTLDKFRLVNGLNTLYKINVKKGHHKLDSLYEEGTAYKLIATIVFSHLISKRFPKINTYLWGAALNYRYGNKKSDIDLILIDKKFDLDDYVYLNKLVNKFNAWSGVVIDVIVNITQELNSLERIRSNRGPSFIHELSYYYFPIRQGRKIKFRSFTDELLKKDAIFADSLNVYRSEKALLNYSPNSPASNWILKLFIYGTYYNQYLRNNLNPDQNFIEKYYQKKNQKVYRLLNKIRHVKSQGKLVSLNFLKQVVQTHRSLFQESKKLYKK